MIRVSQETWQLVNSFQWYYISYLRFFAVYFVKHSFPQTYICLKSILLIILLPFSISLHHLWYQTTYQIMEEDIHQLSCFVGHHVCSTNSQSETDGNHLTSIYCTAIGWSLGDVIWTILTICNNINYIYQKCKIKVKNHNRGKPEILRLLVGYNHFQIGCVFVK